MYKVLITLLLALSSLIPPVIILPTPPPVPTPAIIPVDPTPITTIQSNELYVIRSESHITIVTIPENLIKITEDSGPIKIKSVFTGGSGKLETKTFTEKFIYELESNKEGSGTIIIIPDSVKDKKDLLILPIVCGKPTPIPPGPNPKPDNPAPIPEKGFRVGFIYDAGKQLPRGQQDIFSAKVIRDYLNSHCVKGTDDKTPEWRVFDSNVPLTNESTIWENAYKRPHTVIPWIIISNGTTGFEGALPPNVDETLKILKQYGGE